MKVLKYIKDPDFRGVFIRQSSTQLSQAGGLFQEAQSMWKPFGARFRSHPQMVATFPSGAEVQFKYCGADRDTSNFDGLQASLVVFDEAQWHSAVQISYLSSRIRSKAKGPHQLLCTANPLRDSYLYQFVESYLDPETGIPTKESFAKVRYYANYNGAIVTADTREEIEEKYPSAQAQSYRYIAANIYDNPPLIKNNPKYLTQLENLSTRERARLLLGSWHIQDIGDGYWKEDWVEIVDKPPHPKDLTMIVRSWDLAASVVTESNKDPDWTCGVKMARDKLGNYWILDAYRDRKLSDGVMEMIIRTAREDGEDVKVTIPRDSGAGGKTANSFQLKLLAENGVPATSVVMSGHSGKLTRFLPFCTVTESGSVKIVRGDWNRWYMDELSTFTGGRSGHDDAVDATSDAFNTICRSVQLPVFSLPNLSQPSPIPKI